MITNSRKLKDLLYDLSLVIPDEDFDSLLFEDLLLKGLKNANTTQTLVSAISCLKIDSHITRLPKDLVYLDSIAYSVDKNVANLQSIRRAATPFGVCSQNVDTCPSCRDYYTIDKGYTVRTSIKDGYLFIAYKTYPKDSEGDNLIPDYEPLTQSLVYYVLYHYWLMKYNMKEEGAESRVQFFLSMYNLYKLKALSLNNPGIDELENLKNIQNTLVSPSHYNSLFTNLHLATHVNY